MKKDKMFDDKKKTELTGWAGFIIFLGGAAAMAFPGSSNSIIVFIGFLVMGAGAAIILIYLLRKFKQKREGKE